MRVWNAKEAKIVLAWAAAPDDVRSDIETIAHQIGRSPAAVQEFLRRWLPAGKRPWLEKPRWVAEDVKALQSKGVVKGRSPAAAQKFAKRHNCNGNLSVSEARGEKRPTVKVADIATAMGISKSAVYRWIDKGLLRRFKNGVAETTLRSLLRDHPELVPYKRLSREHREWLVLQGYKDPSIKVKRPSTKGILR